jgi:type IV secretory pathway component VirB8
MDDEKLKIVLALLSGIVFGLIFILLAFVLPLHEKAPVTTVKKAPKTHLEKISQGLKKQNE